MPLIAEQDIHIAVIGMGYVGVPLAVAFGRHYPTIGYDIDPTRALELSKGNDKTREVSPVDFESAGKLVFSNKPDTLKDANVYIITVPTPINRENKPDISFLLAASKQIGQWITAGNIVIFESTVYPGCTEEECIPIIEQASGLVYNKDFFAGYSPERINPGDKKHRLESIIKVTSGSTEEAADFVDCLYGKIIKAGTHKTSSIRVAEAAKVIENTQRDLNIALINELAIIFNKLGIDTREVLDAAGTKWNFLPFSPGLVGGHCISVDPYYLTHKAQSIGYHPEVILAGRKTNDGMGEYIAESVIKLMAKKAIDIVGSNILVMGFTFKENCPDIRNTLVIRLVKELQSYHANIDIFDPCAITEDARKIYNISIYNTIPEKNYDAIIVTVAHQEFINMGIDGIKALLKDSHVLYDVKHIFPKNEVDGRL